MIQTITFVWKKKGKKEKRNWVRMIQTITFVWKKQQQKTIWFIVNQTITIV